MQVWVVQVEWVEQVLVLADHILAAEGVVVDHILAGVVVDHILAGVVVGHNLVEVVVGHILAVVVVDRTLAVVVADHSLMEVLHNQVQVAHHKEHHLVQDNPVAVYNLNIMHMSQLMKHQSYTFLLPQIKNFS